MNKLPIWVNSQTLAATNLYLGSADAHTLQDVASHHGNALIGHSQAVHHQVRHADHRFTVIKGTNDIYLRWSAGF